jgi:hypothetical protein
VRWGVPRRGGGTNGSRSTSATLLSFSFPGDGGRVCAVARQGRVEVEADGKGVSALDAKEERGTEMD